MRCNRSLFLTLLVLALGSFTPIHAKGVYKVYTFDVRDGSVVNFIDENFTVRTDDNTKCRVEFPGLEGGRSLSCRVWRDLEPDIIGPAFSVHKIFVRGYNFAGVMIYSGRLDGFAFVEGESAEWTDTIEALPKKVKRIKITFVGRFDS